MHCTQESMVPHMTSWLRGSMLWGESEAWLQPQACLWGLHYAIQKSIQMKTYAFRYIHLGLPRGPSNCAGWRSDSPDGDTQCILPPQQMGSFHSKSPFIMHSMGIFCCQRCHRFAWQTTSWLTIWSLTKCTNKLIWWRSFQMPHKTCPHISVGWVGSQKSTPWEWSAHLWPTGNSCSSSPAVTSVSWKWRCIIWWILTGQFKRNCPPNGQVKLFHQPT